MTKGRKSFFTGLLCLGLCLCALRFMPQRAAAELEIGKVLTTLSSTPVATTESSGITAATSTGGCYISGYSWYDSAGRAFSGRFGTEIYRVAISVNAADGYYFSLNLAVYLNNEAAPFDMSEDLKSITLYRDYAPAQWAPTVIKNPGSETVEIGEFASFVATANYVVSYHWEILDPSAGALYACADLPLYFAGVTTSEDGSEKMNIYNIPAEMNGWKVRCLFSGYGGDTYSSYADITVNHAEPEPTPTPKPTSTPEASPAASPGAAAPAADGEHEHEFSPFWSYDADTHWKECSCGEKTQQATHSMTWETVTEATKKAPGTRQGRCSVCGYSATESVDYDAGGDAGPMRYVIWGIGGVVALLIIAFVIDAAVSSRRRRRRRRRR